MVYSELTPEQEKVIKKLNYSGSVMLMKDPVTGDKYVKKTISAYNSGIYEQLLYESDSRLGIPKIYDFSEKDNQLIVCEEYLGEQNLAEIILSKGSLTEEKTVSIALQVCSTLEFLHSLSPSIIHCDVTPENIMLRSNDFPVLIDFTSAKRTMMMPQDIVDVADKGNPDYMAPEEERDAYPSWETDYYSVGKLINAMLTGDPNIPYVGNKRLEDIIAECTEEHIKKRYRYMQDLIEDLRNYNSEKIFMPYSQRSILPPGFRTGNIIHMLLAIPYYLLTIYMMYDTDPLFEENAFGLFLGALMTFLLMIIPVLTYSNYLGMLDKFPGIHSDEPFVPSFSRFAWGTLFAFLFMIAAVFLLIFIDLIYEFIV